MSRSSAAVFPLIGLVAAIVVAPPAARAVEIRAGDILVADPDFRRYFTADYEPTLWKIDPKTGARQVITSTTVGTGDALGTISSVVVDPKGRIVIGDGYGSALYRVDPTTGDRTVLSRVGKGDGDHWNAVSALATNGRDAIYVLDHLSRNVLRVDPESGRRTIISGPSQGSGPLYLGMTALSVDQAGNPLTGVYTEEVGQTGLMKIDATSGERRIVSGLGVGEGPEFYGDLRDILSFDADSAIVTSLGRLFHVDLITGNRSILSTNGPRIETLFTVEKAGDGSLYLGDEYLGNFHRYDLNTGVHNLLTGNTPEFGRRIQMPQDMFVVVPEPAGVTLVAVAIPITARATRVTRSRSHRDGSFS